MESESEHRKAGINEFERFGIFNTIDALAGGNILHWGAIMKLSYNDVFLKLCMNKQSVVFQQNLRELSKTK